MVKISDPILCHRFLLHEVLMSLSSSRMLAHARVCYRCMHQSDSIRILQHALRKSIRSRMEQSIPPHNGMLEYGTEYYRKSIRSRFGCSFFARRVFEG